MKHITLFFCDITDTFEGKLKNEEIDFINFIDNLKKIKEKHNSDKIIFMFISSEDKKYIKLKQIELSKYLNSSDIIIKDNNDSNKLTPISSEIKLVKKTNILDKVYYADDCKFFHDFIEELIGDVEFESLIPTNGGLKELNEIIESKYFEKQKIYAKNNGI